MARGSTLFITTTRTVTPLHWMQYRPPDTAPLAPSHCRADWDSDASEPLKTLSTTEKSCMRTSRSGLELRFPTAYPMPSWMAPFSAAGVG
ncbi:hypothetical protein EYF80_055668 [Liparis tanakae]|uniref:Uncharacterized protein n=1 Tax=Liparis tanakae TaxID=230148 RepID=A0A4Z2F0I7_9TELE|nr:hypothetical protein EYF80_055668 [Liparis tanakae]